MFSVPLEFQSLYIDGGSLPIELPDGTSPPLSRIYVYPLGYNLLNSSPYPDIVHPRVFVGLKESKVQITLNDNREGILSLGMCPQEVISNIGNPDFCALTNPNSDSFAQYFEYHTLGTYYYLV